MDKLFGTDGVRGIANGDLTPELALALAKAAVARVPQLDHRPRFVVGRDTRLSGDMLEGAVVAGLCSAGADVLLGGVMPTPAVAFSVARLDLEGGIMITASHNGYAYNGLKFFGPCGLKLTEEAEAAMEAWVERHAAVPPSPSPAHIGRATPAPALLHAYISHLSQRAGASLRGMRIVLDCANGSLCQAAPELFRRLGASPLLLHSHPDGWNINPCGGAGSERLGEVVRAERAQVGIAFDGDGDRLTLVDETGAVVDGDQMLAIWAQDLAERGALTGDVVVGTVLTNGGLDEFLAARGCSLVRAPVGDRHVAAEMQRRGAALGGETCGHIIYAPHLWSSDPLLTAIAVLEMSVRRGEPLSVLAAALKRRPQVSVNLPCSGESDWECEPAVWRAVEQADRELGGGGRMVVRPSGTEPVLRIMVEHHDESVARRAAEAVAAAARASIGERRGAGVDVAV